MEEYYFEYKEGDNTYWGSVESQSEHIAPDLIRSVLSSVPWATKQSGEFVGLMMFTPSEHLDNIEEYKETNASPYTKEDWSERLDRAKKMEEGGDNVIKVDLE